MLNISDKLQEHLNQNITNLYPLVIIGDENPLYISTNKQSLIIDDEPVYFDDYNLKVSNLKDSVNINTHKFKTSNLSLSINNYDKLSDNENLKNNVSIKVYYCFNLCVSIDDCVKVYDGKINKIMHTLNIINIVLEDVSNELDVEIPYANLGYSQNVFNKNYINKSIPITYGYLDKAPMIPYLNTNTSLSETKISLLADDVDIVTRTNLPENEKRGISIQGFFNYNDNSQYASYLGDDPESTNNPLYIYKEDYFRVLQQFQNKEGFNEPWGDKTQYVIDDGFIGIDRIFINGFPQNPPASNQLQAIKVSRPSEFKLLKSDDPDEGDAVESGNVGSVVEINPETGILRPEAAIDSNDNPSSILNQSGELDEFATFSEIPNSKLSLNFDEVVTQTVNEFIPYNSEFNGFHYMREEVFNDRSTNYLFNIASFLATTSDELPVRFIKFPTGNQIIDRVENKLLELGYKTNPNIHVQDSWSGKKSELVQQWSLDLDFREAWMIASGLDPDNEYPYIDNFDRVINALSDFPLPDSEWCNPENPTVEALFENPDNSLISTGTGAQNGVTLNNDDTTDNYWGKYTCRPTQYIFIGNASSSDSIKGLTEFQNQNSEKFFPSYVMKSWCSPNSVNSNNVNDIRRIYIGIYNPETMPSIEILESNKILWINLVEDLNNDLPYLYSNDDMSNFAQFRPTKKRVSAYASSSNNEFNSLNIKFESEWNGADELSNEGGSNIVWEDKLMQNNFGVIANPYGLNGQQDVANFGIIQQNECFEQGAGWFLYVEDNISFENVLSPSVIDFDEIENGNPFTTSSNATSVKKGTIIPWGHKNFLGQKVGKNLAKDFGINVSTNYVDLVSGGDNGIEKRLSLLFPFNNIKSSDVIASHTTFWGSLSVDLESGIIGNNDNFIVSAIATDTVDSDNTDANALLPNPLLGFNLIEKDSESINALIASDNPVNWDIRGQNITPNNEVLDSLASDDYIAAWDSPDKFNSISLNYRLESDGNDSQLKIATKLNSVGIFQFTNFEKGLDSNFYADVIGRVDLNSNVIETPSSIIENIVEKEISMTQNVLFENTDLEQLNITLAFSVNEKTSAKKLIEDISKNSSIFPRFNNQSNTLSLTEMKQEYSDSDIDFTIQSKDIVSFNFERTPSSEIKTMVNVQYKKDYETGNYTRDTGYCDGYDFYGNGEGTYNQSSSYFNYDSSTGETTEILGYNYSSLGVKRESNIFTIESDFIRDYESAVKLRDYTYMKYCNYHNIIKIKLPLKYFNAEVGDICNFDSLFNNLKIYGEDYTSQNVFRNNQKIYPYFMVKSITKSTKDVVLDLYQLHELKRRFTAGLGSLTRKSNVGALSFEKHYYHHNQEEIDGISDIYDDAGWINSYSQYFDAGNFQTLQETYPLMTSHLTTTDLNILKSIVIGNIQNLTSEQLRNADLHRTGNIDYHDVNVLEILLEFYNFVIYGVSQLLLSSFSEVEISDWNIGTVSGEGIQTGEIIGDLTQDGLVNVSDVIILVNAILGSSGNDSLLDETFDLSGDGNINIGDVIRLVNIILG